MYPVFNLAGLAKFTGRPAASFSDYVDEALDQAVLFFKKATCLAQFPTDSDDAKVATKAIYQLADYFVLAQPHAETLATPFSSESIGSYSYSKMVSKITHREETGLLWFDMAVADLGVCETGAYSITGGGIEAFEFDNPRVAGHSAGNTQLLGPDDLDQREWIVHDPSDGTTFDGTYDGGTP